MKPTIILLGNDKTLSREDEAKLQALYSRSASSVQVHLDRVRSTGSSKFMSDYYLNYGHSSIADCATATVFIEGVTHLCAKAIQDTPLYNGQECSTRYIDFSARPCLETGSPLIDGVSARWMEAYRIAYAAMRRELEAATPGDAGDKTRANAIHARACDVARCYLPANSLTQLSWTTTLRQFGDRLALLAHHPLDEVREVAGQILAKLAAEHPGSFRLQDYPERSDYLAGCGDALFYPPIWNEAENPPGEAREGSYSMTFCTADRLLFNTLNPIFGVNRPPKTALPRPMMPCGRFTFIPHIDFGAYRDLQRHRNGYSPLPMLKGRLNLHGWYEKQLPKDAVKAIAPILQVNRAAIAGLTASAAISGRRALNQYAYPLGHKVESRHDYDLCQAVYVAEMRTSRFVHPTLREAALDLADAIEFTFPDLPLHIDDAPIDGSVDLKRGEQTLSAPPQATK